ncbi:hypothetical protein [Stenoxybacter acetivorans]|uniref:hypothetical protein n=1 Tax=Stenoxybacter acetivorans TaxID=422441 RepID=UPI0012EC03D0|nr:hypothetical protein [Stenoxybacter acetivorans]
MLKNVKQHRVIYLYPWEDWVMYSINQNLLDRLPESMELGFRRFQVACLCLKKR